MRSNGKLAHGEVTPSEPQQQRSICMSEKEMQAGRIILDLCGFPILRVAQFALVEVPYNCGREE